MIQSTRRFNKITRTHKPIIFNIFTVTALGASVIFCKFGNLKVPHYPTCVCAYKMENNKLVGP